MGTKSNRDAVGARVYARSAATRQMREVVAGDGYGSQNSLRQYFGLGDATTVDELVVQVAAGRASTQTFTNVAGDRIVADHREASDGAPDSDPLVEKHYASAGDAAEVQ